MKMFYVMFLSLISTVTLAAECPTAAVSGVSCDDVNASKTASFTLQDKTLLPAGKYAIYVAGYSASPGYYLKNDGTWEILGSLPSGTTQIPCYRLGNEKDQINTVVIDASQTTLSARVYYFVVTDTSRFPACANGTPGIFNTADILTFSRISGNNYNVVQPSLLNVREDNLPIYSFSEIGPGSEAGTIDLSQVDFFSFPMNIRASVIPAGKGALPNPDIIGNTFDKSITKSISFADNSIYTTYLNKLAGTGACEANPEEPACAYLDLSSPYDKYNYLVNPGNYLQQVNKSNIPIHAASKLNNAFDTVIKKLWDTKAPVITLNNGGPQGDAPQDTFTGKVVSMVYPCSAPTANCPTDKSTAIKFVGKNSGYVFYVFNPLAYDTACSKGMSNCPVVHSSGYQVFAGAGVFSSTASTEYNALKKLKLLPEATTRFKVDTYNAQVARIGLIITQAMNHGVALMQCKSETWQCWNVETNWYPSKESTIYPDITQNLFSRFMHTASNFGGIPLFVRTPGAVKSAGGQLMGMAYGFSNDEQPTPPVAGTISPEVPSKMDQTVQYNGTGPYTITFGPWDTAL